MSPRATPRSGLRATLAAARSALDRRPARPRVVEVGVVLSVEKGVAGVGGLSSVGAGELVLFADRTPGLAFNLDPAEVGVVLLGPEERVGAGQEVRASGDRLEVPVGEGLLGRVVNPLGVPLDGLGAVESRTRRGIEQRAPRIVVRAPVDTPLQTGIKAVDAVVPVGRGQRELIVGDRQTGKTSLAIDTIANQRGEGVLCVYCAIGQQDASVSRSIRELRDRGAMGHTVVVVASGDEPPGLQFVAPYAATSIAEHFMSDGRDALVVYDDLTSHAEAYRELSLLLRRPPGREGYPGDIFHIHARLLERSTRRKPEFGGGSITALPIVETRAENITAYIPTNLISITDGQIYLSPELMRRGVLPAVDIGRSVSRVGGDAQRPAYRAVLQALKLSYSQFVELEIFSRFASQLDEETRRLLVRGRRVREALKQPEASPVPVGEQVAVLLAATGGVLDEVPVDDVEAAELALRDAVRSRCSGILEGIAGGRPLSPEDADRLRAVARDAVGKLRPGSTDAR